MAKKTKKKVVAKKKAKPVAAKKKATIKKAPTKNSGKKAVKARPKTKPQPKKKAPVKAKKAVKQAPKVNTIIKVAKQKPIAKIKEVKAKPTVTEKPIKQAKPVKQAAPKKIIRSAPIIEQKPKPAPIRRNEPKGKYELEFVIKSSPSVLFDFVSTPSGLQEWFADNVTIKGDIHTFHWDGSQQDAEIIDYVYDDYIAFQWLDKNDGAYFQFKVQIDELTNDVSLIITDFADNDAEKKSATLLWESQVHKLMKVIGSGA